MIAGMIRLLALLVLGTWPVSAFSMHIAEGIIRGKAAIIYTLVGLGLVGWGAHRMKRFADEFPEKKPLFGMGAAIIFFVSLVPIPAFTGTTSHPCGTPLIAILMGPSVAFALTGISLFLQAAFFAHGGFGTWGANVIALGFFGGMFGWGTFHLLRRLGLPILVAGFGGGLVGDVMVYAASGTILGSTLAMGPQAQYGFLGYLGVIFAAYAPTQVPIAFAEMLVTGIALRHALRQRPEVLRELGVWGP